MTWTLFHGLMRKHSKECPPPFLQTSKVLRPWALSCTSFVQELSFEGLCCTYYTLNGVPVVSTCAVFNLFLSPSLSFLSIPYFLPSLLSLPLISSLTSLLLPSSLLPPPSLSCLSPSLPLPLSLFPPPHLLLPPSGC